MTDYTEAEAREKISNLVEQIENMEEMFKRNEEKENKQKDGYGFGYLYAIPSYRGNVEGVDLEVVRQKLIEYGKDDSIRRSEDSGDIMYQDHEIPFGDIGPKDDEITKVLEQIMDGAKEFTGLDGVFQPGIWTISNGYNDQIFPHSHNIGPYEFAFVYWAQVPEGSGFLEFYPKGWLGHCENLTLKVEPKEGDFFIFPGDILHGVRQNTNPDELRVSMSGNITVDPDVIANIKSEYLANNPQDTDGTEQSLVDIVE